MIKLGNFNAVIDSCILYDSLLRDILLRLAEKELYQPIWSNVICEEVKRNLLKRIAQEKVDRLIRAINNAFPEAIVDNYCKLPSINEDRINNKDKHVLSTAIVSNAQVIVTANLKDFPNNVLSEYNVEAQSPDEFLVNVFFLSQDKVLASFIELEKSLINPPIEREKLFQMLNVRVPQFVKHLKSYLAKNIIHLNGLLFPNNH